MSATTRRYPHFFMCLFQDDSNCCWTCGVLIGYLQPHSDKYDKWQAYSTCWPLCFSMGVSTVWHPAMVKHVCLSLFAWVVTNQWATKNSSTLTLHPGYALWDIPLFFQIEAKYLTCREQLQAKQLRQWLKLMKTLYMVCYAQVDWYKNTSHKNCRQTRCSVVHNLGPALFMLMWKNIHVLCCGFLLISSDWLGVTKKMEVVCSQRF